MLGVAREPATLRDGSDGVRPHPGERGRSLPMIVQERDDGAVILINQTDHAKLSGLFAAHWGNGEFDAPHPRESAVRAAMFHDAGWYAYETAPRLLPTGKPMGFTQVPFDEDTLAAYQWATE